MDSVTLIFRLLLFLHAVRYVIMMAYAVKYAQHNSMKYTQHNSELDMAVLHSDNIL